MREGGVPQTVDVARAYGWAWLNVRCLICRCSHDQKFELLAGRQPPVRIGALAARFYCKQCNGKLLQFELGVYEQGSGQPWAKRRLVKFDNGVALHPSRE